MGDSINAGDTCIITHDIVINGIVAFHKGEKVKVEKIEPNPQRPQHQYVVFSNVLQKRFQMSDIEIERYVETEVNEDLKSDTPDEKKCPFCAEIIKAEAIKCRYCGSELPPEELSEETAPTPTEEPHIQVQEEEPKLGTIETNQLASEQVLASSLTKPEVEAVSKVDGKTGVILSTYHADDWWIIALFITICVVAITILIFLILWPAKTILVLVYILIGTIGLGLLIAVIAGAKEKSSSSGTSSSGTSFSSSKKPLRVCPTCGSNSVERFSRTWKVTKIASVGVLGLGNVHKIFKCKDCGYKW